jgi:hypothetical protein
MIGYGGIGAMKSQPSEEIKIIDDLDESDAAKRSKNYYRPVKFFHHGGEGKK